MKKASGEASFFTWRGAHCRRSITAFTQPLPWGVATTGPPSAGLGQPLR